MRDQLLKECNIRGYAIAQYVGDAIFIPAGAPHQVRNLCNCIKAASDYVSSENMDQCIKLTAEFRKLSTLHLNRADKLQIKNVVYHAAKNACSIINSDATKKTWTAQSLEGTNQISINLESCMLAKSLIQAKFLENFQLVSLKIKKKSFR